MKSLSSFSLLCRVPGLPGMGLSLLLGLGLVLAVGPGQGLAQEPLPEVNAVGVGMGADAFASAAEIEASFGVSLTTDISAYSAEAGEPSHVGSAGAGAQRTAWWRWTAPSDGWCTVDTLRSANKATPMRDTVVAVYSGAAVGALTLVARNDDSLGGNVTGVDLSRVQFYARRDVVYSIAVDGRQAGNVTATTKNVVLALRHMPMVAGTRDGVFCVGLGSNLALQGVVTATRTASGRISGKVVSQLRTWPFTGSYTAEGYFETQIELPQRPGEPLRPALRLRLDGVGNGMVSLDLVEGAQVLEVAPLFPERGVYAGTAPNQGLITSAISGPTARFGAGYANVTVKKTGAVTVAGVAVDGSAFTFASHLHPLQHSTDLWIVGTVPMFGRKGGVVCLASLTPGASAVLLGSVVHIRPTGPVGSFYQAGVEELFSWQGGSYTPPAAGQVPFDFLGVGGGPGELTLMDGGAEMPGGDFVRALTLSAPGKFTFGPAVPLPKPALALNAKTGLVTGSVTDANGVKRKLRGSLVRLGANPPTMVGQATGKTRTLAWDVTP